MNWLADNFIQLVLVTGLALLAIEILVLGFSTFILFFVGLAAVICSSLMYLGLVPDTLLSALIVIALLTGVLAAVLWQPLRNMQNKVEHKAVESDLVGHTFVLSADVSPTQTAQYQYSGITWQLHTDAEIKAGTQVKVIRADVGQFTIVEDQPD